MAEVPPPLKHTFMLTVEVDPKWVRYLVHNSDIFQRQYAGYWLCGVAYDEDRGWLVHEEIDGDEVDDDRCAAVKQEWLLGNPLPNRWFRLNEHAAIRAWEEGVKRWGVNWYEQVDAQREDVVVQLALLGEIRYG